jgi:hypothetical protein
MIDGSTVADYFEKTARKVKWQELGAEFEDHRFRFQILENDLKRLLEEAAIDR